MIEKPVEVDQISSYVIDLFNTYQNLSPFLVYHNILHTQKVVARTTEIASYYLLNEMQMFTVVSAAWFHDCGHLFGPAMGHEQLSAIKMKEYLVTINISDRIIEGIESCILATGLPSNPKSLLEEMLCDADLYHLGTNEFQITDLLVKWEYELRNNIQASNWTEQSLSFLRSHRFYTKYCRELLNEGKIKNLNLLQEKVNQKN